MIQPGDVFFSNNRKGILASLIRFFTRSGKGEGFLRFPISHAGVVTFSVGGITSVQEASDLVQVVPWDKHYEFDLSQDFFVFRPLAGKQAKENALRSVYNLMAGDKYGKLQLIWFVWRWIAEVIFKKRVTGGKNWVTNGVICSELVFWYMTFLGNDFSTLLWDFNPDTVQAEDIRRIIVSRPDLFDFIDARVAGKKLEAA